MAGSRQDAPGGSPRGTDALRARLAPAVASFGRRARDARRRAERWRRPATIIAAAAFVAGAVVAAAALELDWSRIAPVPLLVILGCLAPAGLMLSAISLELSARALGRGVGHADAIAVSAYATVADILPLPGGAVIRGAALVRAGAGVAQSGVMVGLMAALTLCIRLLPAGVAFALWGSAYGWAIVGLGVLGITGMLGWLAMRTTPAVVLGFLLVRVAMLGVVAARIAAGFLAFGLEIGTLEALTLSIAAPIGTAVAIVPSGLGVTEALAAGLAALLSLSPAIAFLVAAVNRLASLAVAALAVLIAQMTRGKDHDRSRSR